MVAVCRSESLARFRVRQARQLSKVWSVNPTLVRVAIRVRVTMTVFGPHVAVWRRRGGPSAAAAIIVAGVGAAGRRRRLRSSRDKIGVGNVSPLPLLLRGCRRPMPQPAPPPHGVVGATALASALPGGSGGRHRRRSHCRRRRRRTAAAAIVVGGDGAGFRSAAAA